MKKLLLSCLALTTMTPIVQAGYFSITKEILKSVVIGAELYGSYRLLNQPNAWRLAIGTLVHIPWFYYTQKVFNMIHHTTLTEEEFNINWKDAGPIESNEQVLPFLTYTLGLAALIQLSKTNQLKLVRT